MRTAPEMLNLILHTAKTLQVEAVAMSGSQANPKAPKDEFQDYDVVYVVDDLDTLTSNLAWLDQFGTRIIEQYNILGNRRLYLMLFEDGNRIDLSLCPKEYIQEWVESEANLKTTMACLKPISLMLSATGPLRPPKRNFQHPAMNFGGYRHMS